MLWGIIITKLARVETKKSDFAKSSHQSAQERQRGLPEFGSPHRFS
jgi:hypothetical protein